MATGLNGSRPDRRGTVDTPPELARRLVDPVVRAAGPEARFLDPSCGVGALLAAAEAVLPDPAGRLFGIEADPERGAVARRRLGPRAVVRTADALAVEWPARTHVIANPPWVSFSGRQAARGGRSARTAGGWPSLHGAFVERIADHVADHRTTAAVLLPASVAELEGYAELRARVDRRLRIETVEELGEHAFPGVTEPAILVRFTPRDDPVEGSSRSWLRSATEHDPWIAKLARFPRLPPRTFADPGVHTGNAARELVRRPIGGLPGLREGRSLRAFRLAAPSAGLVTTLERTPTLRFRIAALERYRSFPVLVRQTADRPIAALHAQPTYFRNSLLATRATPGLDAAFVVAVLNGPVAAAWHRAHFRDARQRRFPQVKVGHLATQPVPIATRDDDPALHDRLANCARALAARPGDHHEDDPELARLVLSAFGLDGSAAERILALARPTHGPRTR